MEKLFPSIKRGLNRLVSRYNKRKAQKAAEERKRRTQEEQARRKTLQDTIEAMICTPGPVSVSVKALPKEKRTIYLRYRDLKAKVCRPFARG